MILLAYCCAPRTRGCESYYVSILLDARDLPDARTIALRMPSRACVGGFGHIRWHARRQPCVDAIPTASLPTYLGVARAFGRALWGGERRRRGLTGVLVELVRSRDVVDGLLQWI